MIDETRKNESVPLKGSGVVNELSGVHQKYRPSWDGYPVAQLRQTEVAASEVTCGEDDGVHVVGVTLVDVRYFTPSKFEGKDVKKGTQAGKMGEKWILNVKIECPDILVDPTGTLSVHTRALASRRRTGIPSWRNPDPPSAVAALPAGRPCSPPASQWC